MSSVYPINKGVARPIVFKGLKAQYIGFLAAGLLALFLAFTAGHLLGAPLWGLLPAVAGLAAGLVAAVFRLSRRFGEHGLMKQLARGGLPRYVRFCSRRTFTSLNK